MPVVRLFTSAFPEHRQQRQAEYADCLSRNLACRNIDEIVVLVEGGVSLPQNAKLRRVDMRKRPTYADYLSVVSRLAQPRDLSIIANSDIYFDESIGVLRAWEMPSNVAIALARWETNGGVEATLNERNDSQDAWILRGHPAKISGNFPVGVPRCDNRFVKELEQAGYVVINPAFSIRAYHRHDESRGEYSSSNRDGFVEGPYGYVWPQNLMPLHRTLSYNRQHPRNRVSWRFDTRYWGRMLKLHRIERSVRRILPNKRA